MANISILTNLFLLLLSLTSIFVINKLFNKSGKYADKYIDLHLHLDGAITLDIAKKLALLQNITLPGDDDAELEGLLTVPED